MILTLRILLQNEKESELTHSKDIQRNNVLSVFVFQKSSLELKFPKFKHKHKRKDKREEFFFKKQKFFSV